MEYINTTQEFLDAAKAAADLLPRGEKRDDYLRRLETIEDILKHSYASLGRFLDYKFCQCTFPPMLMLWREQESAHVCTNASCGKRVHACLTDDFDFRDF